jgi:hypothetical protein
VHSAVKPLEKTKSQGLVRYRGIAGDQEPDMIAAEPRRYPFNHAPIPVNAADIYHPHPFIPNRAISFVQDHADILLLLRFGLY